MPKGISLHIGLNSVDPAHYWGADGKPWDGKLNACENDARDMQALANSKGFKSTLVLTGDATAQRIANEIRHAAQQLEAGDIFFMSYSGHGGQLWDDNNDEPLQEPASADMAVGPKDETLCLYDRQFRDDELNHYLGYIKEGVRVLILSDSCHSGTVVKDPDGQDDLPPARQIPFEAALKTFEMNQAFYLNQWQNEKFRGSKSNLKSSVLLISGCQDNQLSHDGQHNGVFTGALLSVWNNGVFPGNYPQLHQKIVSAIPKNYNQTPNYFTEGERNLAFEQQRAFTI